MCGRFSFAPLRQILEERFDVKTDSSYKPRYNIAPTQKAAVISNADPGIVSWYRWGLIPSWAKDPSIGNRLINARSETVNEKPAFRKAFRSKRCLVLSDGFYEWQKINAGQKVPWFITLNDEPLFAMAGLWDEWTDAEGKAIRSFTILTTSPNRFMKQIHHRMPVILPREAEKRWLEGATADELQTLLKPCPEERMNGWPVSTLVNSPANDFPEIRDPVEPAGKQTTLL
ncbi:MAG: SOS response-associated peptidase [Bacteroidales bacterium]